MERKRKIKARILHVKEKAATEKLDMFYLGAATDQILNMDTKEINSFMEA